MNQILHLGLGRFHRAHQAMYYQKAGGWKVISSTMRSPDEKLKLKAAGLRYPVLELSHDSEKLTWIDCIGEALSLHEDLTRLLEVFSSPDTKIVTLTVTEKGYCLGKNGELDLTHPGIKHDLENFENPGTAIGFLALALQGRKEKLTIISCDNLRSNGKKLDLALKSFLKAAGKKSDLTDITFPDTMVDRIVPALLPQTIRELESRHGLKNSELIATETFTQWVIEDHFAGEKPSWNTVGVEYVSNVRAFEEMKLRLLNAAHSFLAYAGLNRGHQFVHEAIHDPELESIVRTMLTEEVIPLLSIPHDFDVQVYVDRLLSRFRNYKLPHQLKQIAMDGSQKMPQRIFSSLHEARERKMPHAKLEKVIDEWLEFLWRSRSEKIDDPKASELLQGIDAGKESWKKQVLTQF
jgi:fructuronate reductase